MPRYRNVLHRLLAGGLVLLLGATVAEARAAEPGGPSVWTGEVHAAAAPEARHELEVEDPTDLDVVLHWEPAGAELRLSVERPDGTVAAEAGGDQAPLLVGAATDRSGTWTLVVRALEGAASYTLEVDAEPRPLLPVLTSPTHPDEHEPAGWSRLLLDLAPSAGAPPIAAWSVVVDGDPGTVPPEVVSQSAATVTADLDPGTWWVHVRGVDAAGTWTPTARRQVQVAAEAFAAPAHGAPVWEPERIVVRSADPVTVEVRLDGSWEPLATAPVTLPGGAAGSEAWFDPDGVEPGPVAVRAVDGQGATVVDGFELVVTPLPDPGARLAADVEAGVLDASAAALLALDALLDPQSLPSRYAPAGLAAFSGSEEALPDLTPGADLLALWADADAVTRQQVVDLLTVEVEPQGALAAGGAGSGAGCGGPATFFMGSYECVHEAEASAPGVGTVRFRILYDTTGERAVAPGEPETVAAGLVDAWHRFRDELGFRSPTGDIDVVLGHDLVSPAAIPPRFWSPFGMVTTTPLIVLRTRNPVSLIRHELFHQVQYRYITGNDVLDRAMVWWMEATAEWAVLRLQDGDGDPAERDDSDYARHLGTVLAAPEEPVDRMRKWLQDRRAYGSFVLAQYLGERFDAEMHASFVEASWRLIEVSGKPPVEVLADLIASRYHTWAEEIVGYRQWTYVLSRDGTYDVGFAHPHANAVPGGDGEPDLHVWREVLADQPGLADVDDNGKDIVATARPRRHVADVALGGTDAGTAALYPSGAVYVDVDLPPSAHLHVRVDSDHPNTHASVLLFGEYPNLCQAPVTVPLSGGSGEALVGTGNGCHMATLVLVNRAAPFEQPRGLLGRRRSAGAPTAVDWEVMLAGEPDHWVSTVATHGEDVYLAGRTAHGRLVVGSQEVAMAEHGGYVARRLPDGTWHFLATATGIQPSAIVPDADGAYVAGSYFGTATFAPGISLPQVVGGSGFVARVDRHGEWQWARATSMRPHAAARAPDGTLWLAGWFDRWLRYDGQLVDEESYGGHGAAVLLALDDDGTFVGSAHLGARYNRAEFRALTVSADGRLFAVGVHGGKLAQGHRVVVNGYTLPSGTDCCSYRLSGLVVEADPGLVLGPSASGTADMETGAVSEAFRWGLSVVGNVFGRCYSRASADAVVFEEESGRLVVSGSMYCGTYPVNRDDTAQATLAADPSWGTSAYLATIDPDGDHDPDGQPWGRWEQARRLTTGVNAGSGAFCPCATFFPPHLATDGDGSVYGASAVESRVKLPEPLTWSNSYAELWDTEVVALEAHVDEGVLDVAWIDRPWSPETVDRPQGVALTAESIWIGGAYAGHRLAAGDRFMTTPVWFRVRLGGPAHRGPTRTGYDGFLLERPRTPPPPGE